MRIEYNIGSSINLAKEIPLGRKDHMICYLAGLVAALLITSIALFFWSYECRKMIAAFALLFINPRKPFGTALFNAIARVSVSVGHEAVCIRRNPETQAIEVFLVQRSINETAYPGEWHCPGSVMRPGEDPDNVFARLRRREFFSSLSTRRLVGISNNLNEARGHFVSVVYLCETDGETRGEWFPVDALPKKTVDHHRNPIIPMAVKEFLKMEA